MSLITQESRILIKRSNMAGVVPTIPASGSTDHTDGTWLATDIYAGELFINTTDEKVWYGSDTQILQLYPQTSAGTQDVFYYNTYTDFSGLTGSVDKIYIAKDTHLSYIWNSTFLSYEIIGSTSVVYWNNIIGTPSATTTQIDYAVSIAHGVNDFNSNYLVSAITDLRYVLQETGSGLTENNFTDYYKGILDAGISNVYFGDDLVSLPIPGATDILYVCKTDLTEYLWDTYLGDYILITGNSGSTDLTGYVKSNTISQRFMPVCNYGNELTDTDLWVDFNNHYAIGSVSPIDNYKFYIKDYRTSAPIQEYVTLCLDTYNASGTSTSLCINNEINTDGNTAEAIKIFSLTNKDSQYNRGIQVNLQGKGGMRGILNNLYPTSNDKIVFGNETVIDLNTATGNTVCGHQMNIYGTGDNDNFVQGMSITIPFGYTNSYCLQLNDSSVGVGKVLMDIDGTGNAQWRTLPTPSGGTGTFTGGTIDHLTITNDLLLTNPTSGTTLTQILSRNPATGLVEYVPSTEFVSTSQLARNTAGTGILFGGNMTQSSTTHINIDAGAGTISLHQPDGDTSVIDLTWSAKTYVEVPVGTGLGHYVFIDENGDVMFKVATDPAEPGDLRSNIYLGLVGHSALSAITAIISAPVPAFNVINTVDELAQGIGPFSLDGNSLGLSGTLSLSITAGDSFQIGGNLHNELNLPNVITTTGLPGGSILNMVKSTAFLGPGTSECPMTQWDDLGTLTTLANAGNAAAHRIWYQPTTNKLYFQYGQATYADLNLAINGYYNEAFVTPTNLTQNSYLVAVICATKNNVDWTNSNRFKLIPQSKFASKGGGGVGAFDTLQSTYNNSTTPEILTDTTRGPLSLKRGTAADTDKVLEVLDGSSNINFSVLGNGSVSATTYYGDGSNLTGISGGVTSNITNATNLYLYNNFI